MKTNYCLQHNVCLCSNTYTATPSLANILCPHEDWSCWRKFHEYYLPSGLFNDRGHILRASSMNRARRELTMANEEEVVQGPTPFVPYSQTPTFSVASAVHGELTMANEEVIHGELTMANEEEVTL